MTLVGGGTFAYFSSTSTSSASFNNGTLSLQSDPSVIVNLSNLKPGDTVLRDFKLKKMTGHSIFPKWYCAPHPPLQTLRETTAPTISRMILL
ncbi:TasA family protein [Paenibacillus rhizoplanae]